MRLSPISLALQRPPGMTLAQQAINILRRPGLESHVYMPGVGWVNGLSLTNTIMEDGTQAASVDNPVGYMGDAASTTLEAELVTNGDFSVDANWTKGTGWTISGGVATHAAGASSDLTQAFSLTGGRSYQVNFTVSGYSGSGNIRPRFYGGTTSDGSVVSGNGVYSQVITANSGNSSFAITVVSTATCSIDNISVRELVRAIPARQATTANKPILRRGHVNRIRNSTMVGAVAGTPGTPPTNWGYGSGAGITRTIVGTGTADGIPYIDVRFNGTATATVDAVFDPEAGAAVAALSGQNWTGAMTLALIGGAWPVRSVSMLIIERNSGGSFLVSSGVDVRSIVTGATPVRVTTTRTLNQATTAAASLSFRCPVQTGDVIDFTIRVSAPQLEQGSVANTFVPTTTAAASASTGPFWAEYDGTDFMSLAAVPFQQADDHVVIAGVEATSYNNNFVFAIRSSAATNPIVAGMRIEAATGLLQGLWRDDAGTLVTPSVAGAVGLGTKFVGTLRFSASTRQVRRNAGAWTSSGSALGATTVNNATIGASVSTTTTGHVTGSIYPVIVIKGTVTDAELATLERWVAQMSGVQL